jgi:UDP-N-acetylmuramate dehydrogenase
VTRVNIEANKLLASFTTLRVGGPARFFAVVQNENEIEEVVSWASRRRLPLFVLGGGSNLLVSDAGFDGLVLQVGLKGIHVRDVDLGESVYEVAAGEDWDHFVQRAVDDDRAGIECLAGIPGTVGGTPVQNVGAYGQEVATTINRVRAFDLRELSFAEFTAAECEFAYRHSRFNTSDKDRYVVTRVDYQLIPGGAPTLRYAELQRSFPLDSNPTLDEVAKAVRRIRRSKGMLLVEGDQDCRSAGSFFKNPVVSEDQAASVALVAGSEPARFPAGPGLHGMIKLPAAWLIEKAGFAKGYSLGRAGISHKHTLALVNRGGATSAEMLALAGCIRTAVTEKFGIDLQMEPVMLGFQ